MLLDKQLAFAEFLHIKPVIVLNKIDLDDKHEFLNIQKIYDMHIKLLNQNFYIHPIVLNNQNQVLTYINSEPYILMITIYYKNKITINDILYFSKETNSENLIQGQFR